MSEWELEFGSDAPQRAGDLVKSVVDGRMSAHMTANQRAAAAWYRANGDRERSHTTGVFLKKARRAGAAPILGVYVDSHAMATDFGVNKDIYLARLANIGYEVSGIEFLPSRKRRADTAPKPTSGDVPEQLPPLSQAELREVTRLVAQAPDSLKASVSKAVTLSFQREKLKRSKSQEKS